MTVSGSFVLDCSMALAWCFPDEHALYPQSVLDSLAVNVGAVPSLWRLEVANALLVSERRNRCTAADVVAWLGFLAALPLQIDPETEERAWSDTLGLARAYDLSVYDASYLELASRRGWPLASLDRKLNTAATAAGIVLYAPPPP
jgi:predicted nucleic acid-binding protein